MPLFGEHVTHVFTQQGVKKMHARSGCGKCSKLRAAPPLGTRERCAMVCRILGDAHARPTVGNSQSCQCEISDDKDILIARKCRHALLLAHLIHELQSCLLCLRL